MRGIGHRGLGDAEAVKLLGQDSNLQPSGSQLTAVGDVIGQMLPLAVGIAVSPCRSSPSC